MFDWSSAESNFQQILVEILAVFFLGFVKTEDQCVAGVICSAQQLRKSFNPILTAFSLFVLNLRWVLAHTPSGGHGDDLLHYLV
jgi:hypothetical protein